MGALDILKKAILNNPGGGAAAPMTAVQQETAAQQNAKPTPAPQAAGRVTKPASQTTGRAAGSATPAQTSTPVSQAARNTNTTSASTTPAVKPLRGVTKKTLTDAVTSTIANASQASVPTVTQGQHNVASQQAARRAAQAAASNSTVRKKNTDSITSALGRVNDAVTAGSLRGQDAAGMYQTLSSRIGAPLPNEFHMLSSSLNETGRQLEEQYTSVVEPAYKAYQEAEQKYLNGELSRPEFLQARQNYVDAYNRYSPAWDAWNDMGRTNTQSYWSDSDLDEVSGTLELYNSAIEIGQSRIDELNKQLTDMVQNYNSAGAELQRTIERLNGAEVAYRAGQITESDYLSFYDSYETQYNALNDAWAGITELEGQISAESLYLSEIASIGKYGYDTWERRYMDAHPEIGWRSDVGLEYDADGNVVRNDTNFTNIFSRIEALQADNAEGQNDREIAEYYRILNNGLAYVNMDSEELNSRRDYFQSWIDDAQPELESLAWLDDYNAAVEMGGSYTVPEGRDYDADTARRNELQSRVDQAKYWINQLNTREYEMTYDPVIKGLSQDTQDLINRFILNEGAADQAMELVRSNPRFVNPYETYAMVTDIGEQTSLDRQIRDALAGENLTEDQIRGILKYARFEADAVRADRMENDIIESTAETNTFVNYLNQLFLSLGSGAGAVENAARGLWALGGNFDFDTEDPLVGHISSNNNIDPYLGKVAPINYNSFGNLSTIAARAVGQGEFQRIQNFFVDDPENPDAGQQRMAQFAYNAYNLAESMGQSALIGLMAGAGMKNSLLLLSGSAASNTMQDLHEQGYSDAGVIVGGLVSGFAEYITEQVSLENLLSVYNRGDLAGLTGADLGRALGVNVLTQTLSEGSEEGASDLVNLMYDQTMGQLLNGGLTQIQYNAVQAQQANPSLSWEDAIEDAWQDWCKELGQDMVMGALSGGLMGAGGYGLGYVGGAVNAANTGRQINQAGGNNRFELMAEAQELADRLGSQATGLDRALQRGADTDLQVGRLFQSVMDARALEAINTRLTELGEENASPELLRAINARAGGDHLLPGERIALSQSQHGQQVINELQAYNEAVQNAQDEGAEPDLENVEQWTLDRALEQAATQSKYTETATGSNYIAQRANEQKLRYEATQRANPEANILKPISQQIVDEGASPEVAAKQGEILGKVFSGTVLTNKEMRALDMNNPAVRKVFVDRSGLTGIPSGTIQESLKRTYVNQVTRESALIQERQANLSADTDRLMEAKQVINAERVAAQKSVNERKQKNPFARIVSTLTGGGIRAQNAANRRVEAMDKYGAKTDEKTRAGNKERREEQAQAEAESRTSDAHRNDRIDISGKTADQVIQEVAERAGVDAASIPRWADYWARYSQTITDSGMDEGQRTLIAQGQYMNSLSAPELGLKRAEITAIANAQFAESRQGLTDVKAAAYSDSDERSGKDGRETEVRPGEAAVGGELSDNGGGRQNVGSSDTGGTGGGVEGDLHRLRERGGVHLLSLQDLIGADEKLTDDKNLSVVPIEEIVTEDGKPGPREGLFYIREYLASLGIPADRIMFVDGHGEQPGILIWNLDHTAKEVARGQRSDGKILLLANNDQGKIGEFNPIRTGVHEGLHELFRMYPELWKQMTTALNDAGYESVIKKAAAAYKNGKYGATIRGNQTRTLYEEVICDLFKRSIRSQARGLGAEMAHGVIIDVLEQNVPGFDRAAYDELMRRASELYPAQAQTPTPKSKMTTEQAHEQINMGKWEGSLLDLNRFRNPSPAPAPATATPAEQEAQQTQESKKTPETQPAQQTQETKPKKKPAKPRTAEDKVPEEYREITRDDYLHSQLGDPDAKFVDEGNVRKLAADDQELRDFEALLRSGANYVFVSTAGAENSKQYYTNGSPTARLRGAVSYITVRKGDTMQDVLVRMRQGLFDQTNRAISKKDMKVSELSLQLTKALKTAGVDTTQITRLAETIYTQRAWDAHILYDCYYDTSNPNNELLSDEGIAYAEQVDRSIGADHNPELNTAIERVFDKNKYEAMYANYRAWALYQFYRDVFAGARSNSDYFTSIADAVDSLIDERRLQPTWDFERRLDEENKLRTEARNKWLREQTFSQNKADLKPLNKADRNTVSSLLADAERRGTAVQQLLAREEALGREIRDLTMTLQDLQNGMAPEDLFDLADEVEDYMTDPRFAEHLAVECRNEGIDPNDPSGPLGLVSEFDFQDAYARAWDRAVKAYNEELNATRKHLSGREADWHELYDPDAAPAPRGTTGGQNRQTQQTGLAAADQTSVSALEQRLKKLRAEQARVRADIVEARSAAEKVRDQRLAKMTRLPYQTLAAQLYDDVLNGRSTAQQAFDRVLGVYDQLQKNPQLTVQEAYGATLTTNYRSNYRSLTRTEYTQAQQELKAAAQSTSEDLTDEPSARERNASVLAHGNAEQSEHIRAVEQAKRDQTRRESALKTVKDAKNEAGKTDSDRSEVTPTDVRNTLLDQLNEAQAGLLNAPVGYSPDVKKVATLSEAAKKNRRKHSIRMANRTADTTVQEGEPLWKGTGQNTPEDRSLKNRVLDGAKAAGNAWMYSTFSDCWALEKAGMKQTRLDGIKNRINLLRGSNETAQYIYTTALVDRNGNYIGKSMSKVMLCWSEDSKTVDTEAQEKLQQYLLLMHNIDRMSVEERALQAVLDFEELHPELKGISNDSLARLIVELNNPIAKEYYRLLQWEAGAENKPVLAMDNGEPMNAATAQKLAEDMLETDSWLASKAQDIYDWWDMFMREWGVGGRMSAESYENMRQAYPHYVPTYRAGDGKFISSASYRGSTEISIGPAIHAAKGSTLEILPIEDQFAMLASQYVQGARANELAWNFMQELMFSGEANNSDFGEFGQIDYDRTAEEFINERIEDDADPMDKMIEHDEKNHEYRVNCWVDGKTVSAYVSKEIYESFRNLLKKQDSGYKRLMQIGNATTSLMKEFITGANPSFALRNLAGDIPTAVINSTVGLKFMRYWFQAAEQIRHGGDAWEQFKALGGTNANLINPRRGFVAEATKREHVGKKILGGMEKFGEVSESITRFAEYLATIDKLGDSPEARMAAIHNAAEVTVDFSRAGYHARLANAWTPYFNPAVQGVYKVFRSVAEAKGLDKAKVLGRAALTTIPVELLLCAIRGICKRDKDFEEESDYVKDNYYLIPLGGKTGHKWLKIRKNREWAAVFGNALMRALEGANGYSDPFNTYFDISIAGNFLPDAPVPLFVQWILDAADNKNYAGSTIVPSTFEDFKEDRPMDVFNEDTSALAYGIASVATKLVNELNPMFVDYMLSYYMGDFFTNAYSWFDMGLLEEVQETDGSKTLTFAKGALDALLGARAELTKDWVTNSLYSNSTMSRYYDLVSGLKSTIGAEKYLAGGSTGSLEEQIYSALYYSDLGYASQITALAKEARALPEGEEKDRIKAQQIVLAHAAMDFYDRCMSGEISDPIRYIRYSDLNDSVANELIRLGDYSDQFEFEPTFDRVSSLRDPENTGYHFMLSDEQKTEYAELMRQNYSDAIVSLMHDPIYRAAQDGLKAMMLAQKRSEVRAATNEEFIKTLRAGGAKPTQKTLAEIEVLQLEAQYALARINDPASAVSENVSDELIRLRGYASDYSFVMSTSRPKTFSRTSSSDYVFVLNARQQDYYSRLRSSLYNEAMESILASSEYRQRNDEGKVAMLQAASQVVSKQLQSDFDEWLSNQTDAVTRARVDLSQGALEQDAEFAVTRVLTPENAYSREVTDELVRLYGYSDAYSFQPSTYRPSGYDDPNRKGYRFYLTEEQKDKYQEIAHQVYDTAFKVLMSSSRYTNETDAGKAELLDSMRGQLAEEVKDQFLDWLSKNADSQKKPDTTAKKELDAIVKRIIGW